MTHTWSDVAYGIFVGANEKPPTIALFLFLGLVAFVVWRATR